MGTWAKETVYLGPFREYPTGLVVTSGIVSVDLLPEENTWPTGKIACVAGTIDTSIWFPSADLDDTVNYEIYLNSVFYSMYFAKNASPGIGEV